MRVQDFREFWEREQREQRAEDEVPRRVILQVGWNEASTLREVIEFWLETRGRDPLFLLTFCGSASAGVEDVKKIANEGCAWARDLVAQWPMDLRGMYRMGCGGGRVVVHLGIGDCGRWISGLTGEVDTILVDLCGLGWRDSPKAFTKHMARVAKAGAQVRLKGNGKCDEQTFEGWIEALQSSGFCESGNGVRNTWEGRYAGRKRSGSVARTDGNHAIVVGGGVAGVSVAASLSVRGWGVELFEQRESLAAAASGNLAAVCVPMISRDDGLAARLSRACFLHGLAELEEFSRRGIEVLHAQCGVLQFPRMVGEGLALELSVRQGGYPADYVQWWSEQEVAVRFNCEQSLIRSGAAFFPRAGWINPASLCEARLQVAGNVRIQKKVRVESVRRVGKDWELRGASGEVLAQAPVVVLANGEEMMNWEGSTAFRFKRVRGQVTHVGAGEIKSPEWVVCGDGYVTPAVQGIVSVGATYDFEESRGEVLESCGRENLGRLGALIPGCPEPDVRWASEGRVGFRMLSADRLPAVGALADGGACSAQLQGNFLEQVPRLEGMYGFLGLGSRGILWSGLGAEFLAARISGEPLPLERDLSEALDPARWILRQMRGRQ